MLITLHLATFAGYLYIVMLQHGWLTYRFSQQGGIETPKNRIKTVIQKHFIAFCGCWKFKLEITVNYYFGFLVYSHKQKKHIHWGLRLYKAIMLLYWHAWVGWKCRTVGAESRRKCISSWFGICILSARVTRTQRLKIIAWPNWEFMKQEFELTDVRGLDFNALSLMIWCNNKQN